MGAGRKGDGEERGRGGEVTVGNTVKVRGWSVSLRPV